jgi:hypothetical protein
VTIALYTLLSNRPLERCPEAEAVIAAARRVIAHQEKPAKNWGDAEDALYEALAALSLRAEQ